MKKRTKKGIGTLDKIEREGNLGQLEEINDMPSSEEENLVEYELDGENEKNPCILENMRSLASQNPATLQTTS